MALNRHHDEPIYFTPPPVRGRYPSGLWKDSPSTPAAPDPYKTADAQLQANLTAARATNKMNRYDTVTPWGTVTWKQGGDGAFFDQTAYDKALQQYNADMAAYGDRRAQALGSARGNAGDLSGVGFINDLNSQGNLLSSWESANPAPTAVNEQDFWTNYDPDKWTMSVEMSPEMAGATGQQQQQFADIIGKGFDVNSLLPGVSNPNDLYGDAWSRITSVEPAIDPIMGQYSNVTGSMGTALGNVDSVLGQDFNYNSLGALPSADESTRKAIADAMYGRATSRLDPKWQIADDQLRSRLAAQGITQGSEAYDRELAQFGRDRNDAYQMALDAAETGSTSQMAQLFDMAMGRRAQGVSEANYLRSLPFDEASKLGGLQMLTGSQLNQLLGTEMAQNKSAVDEAAGMWNLQNAERESALNNTLKARMQVLNELNALRNGGQVGQAGGAGTSTQVNAAPIAQLMQNQWQGQVADANAQTATQNANTAAIASIAAAFLMSDRRLKSDIQRIGTHPLGIGVYSYEIFGAPTIGVMADEVAQVMPEAVFTLPSGLQMVNYGMLQ